MIGLTTLVVASPVLIVLGRLAWTGDYLAPWPLWRSGTAGADLASAVLGNPFSSLSGAWTRAVYSRHGIDAIEQSAWLGLVAPLLAAIGMFRSENRARGLWLFVGILAGVWALGPHLRMLGWNSGIIMPNAVLRYLPLVSNARIPGRALVIVTLALAMLAAMGWARLRESNMNRWWLLPLLVLISLELGPMPFPLTTLDHPALYDVARVDPQPGSLLELPLGIRDGFGEEGNLDHRVLWYQSIHERPLVGGFVARLPPSTRTALLGSHLITDLLALSRPGGIGTTPTVSPEAAGHAVDALGVAFVVLDRRRASAALQAYTMSRLPLEEVATADERTLYRIVHR